MASTSQLWLFFGIVLGVVLLPGLDMSFVLATTLVQGWRGGLAAVGGIVAAGLVHVTAGAAGLAAVVALVPALFGTVLLAGAAYLIWIGIALMRAGVAVPELGAAERAASLAVPFRRGMVTNLLNPKAYAFMFAVFPQFVAVERGPIWLQAVPLWVVIASTQLGVYGAVVLLAGGVRDRLARRPRALLLAGRAIGAFLVAAALVTAWRGLS